MKKEIPIANGPLTPEEQLLAAKLTAADLQVIDASILAHSSTQWRKVAMVVCLAEKELGDKYPGLSGVFYAKRLIHLAEKGALVSQGNLEYMRFSEVRIPT